MALFPVTSTLSSGAYADTATETYDIPTIGHSGLLFVSDVTAIGTGQSFVTSADITLPVVIDGSHKSFNYNSVVYTIALGTYSTLATLAAAIGAATASSATPFSTVVTVAADPNGTGLRYTSVPTGVNVLVFNTGTTNDCIARIGLTDGWTISHSEAAGADASASQTITIKGKDEASGKYYDILVAAAQTTVSTKILRVFPGALASANLIANDVLPANVRISISHTTDDAVTRTLGLQLVS